MDIFIEIAKCPFRLLPLQFKAELCRGCWDSIRLCLWIQVADHLLSRFTGLTQLNKELALVQGRGLVSSF